MKLTIVSKSILLVSTLRDMIASVPGPFEILSAQQQLNKFRKLDADALRDMGLTPTDVENASLRSFLGDTARR